MTWGSGRYGGDTQVHTSDGIEFVQATASAFAAVLGDGSVVTWGNPQYGGESTSLRGFLRM